MIEQQTNISVDFVNTKKPIQNVNTDTTAQFTFGNYDILASKTQKLLSKQ